MPDFTSPEEHAAWQDYVNELGAMWRRQATEAKVRAGEYVRRKLPSKRWRKLRAQVFARDGEQCRYCDGREGPWHIDHVIPLCQGGTWELSNLVVSCRDCNQRKGARERSPQWQSSTSRSR